MSDKIVSLRGDAPPEAQLVNQRVVELLERLLGKAQRGEICAFGFVQVAPNRNTFTGWVGMEDGYTHELMSSAGTLVYRMHAEGALSQPVPGES